MKTPPTNDVSQTKEIYVCQTKEIDISNMYLKTKEIDKSSQKSNLCLRQKNTNQREYSPIKVTRIKESIAQSKSHECREPTQRHHMHRQTASHHEDMRVGAQGE